MSESPTVLGQAIASPRVVIAALLTLIAFVYLPTLRYGFVYDDGWTLLSNGLLRHPEDLGILLSPDAAARHVPDAFRPTLVVFDTLSYWLLGARAPLQHAVSVLLHLTVCAALVAWLRRLGAPLLLRASTLALFGLMAIHAEAVAVVSFREDLLAAALGLSALVIASRGLDGPAGRRWALAAAATLLMALSAGAKANAAMLPGVWLLAEWLSPWRERRSLRRILPVALALHAGAALTFVQTLLVYGSWSPYQAATNPRVLASRTGLSGVLAESARIHVDYVQQMFLPFGLSPEYVDRTSSWSDPTTLACAGALAGLLGVGVWAARRGHSVLALAILGSFLLAIPTSNAFGLPNMRSDRFMYLPSVTASLGIAALALWLGRRVSSDRGSQFALAPLVLLCVVQGAMARATASNYASNATLWRVALERAPGSARAHAMAGLTLLGQTSGRELPDPDVIARTRRSCDRALALDPAYELPHLCKARLATMLRDWGSAHQHYARALEVSPDRNDRNLAASAQLSLDLPGLSAAERQEMAWAAVARGLREYPYSPELRVAAGRIAHQTGRPWLALHLYRGARDLRPERWETVLAGLELALDLGDAAAAQRTWLQAHELVGRADPAARRAISARIADAHRLYPTPLLQSLLDPGVFPNDP